MLRIMSCYAPFCRQICGFLAVSFLFGLAQAAEFVVINTENDGAGSLRNAIQEANSSPGPDRIVFQISGPAPHTISLETPLPTITESVTIDAGGRAVTDVRQIELDGRSAGLDAIGLDIAAPDCLVRGLCINGFSGYGILVDLGGRNKIQGNFIGTDPTGHLSRPNGQAAVAISDSAGNLIGGTQSHEVNLLSGNVTGVFVVGSGSFNNSIQGNFIGTDVTGTNALPNSRNGVLIFDAANNRVGGPEAGARNVIAANGQSGIYLIGAEASFNTVAGNLIGVDATGKKPLGNQVDGVSIFAAARNLIGGTNNGAGNVISGNIERGIFISGEGASNNVVQGNFIGTDPTGTNALGNQFSGVGLVDAAANTIGGDSTAARNIISGNNQSGVAIGGAGSSNNIVIGNFIGTDRSGSLALGNRFNGIAIVGAPDNIVGGNANGATNLISGNIENGIFIGESGATGNQIEGNLIGCDIFGQSAIGNGVAGLQIQAPANQVGRSGGKPNVISGNVQSGIYIFGSASLSNRIEGNYIGTDLSGQAALGNVGGIVLADASRNFIGGASVGKGNLVSGNIESGIYLSGAGCSNNMVQGNWIGTSRDGKGRVSNTGDGVSLYGARANTIGGTQSGAGNLISGNDFAGIFITGSSASNNLIAGNLIGTQQDGVSALGNRLHGVEIDNNASGNSIGTIGPDGRNRIAFARTQGASGVRLHSGTGNDVRFNSIFSNGGLAIDLGNDGVTANDKEDEDEGANHLQNFPVITGVTGGPRTSIRGILRGSPATEFILDFYVSAKADESGYGEAGTWLGSANVRTDDAGGATFGVFFPVATATGNFVAATCTDSNHNTSELSLAMIAQGADTDADGLPDEYETVHDLNPSDGADAATDPDSDGLSNLQEYFAGTNPRDEASTLTLNARRGSNAQTVLSFPTATNRRYRIEYTDQLDGRWRTLTEMPGTGTTNEFIEQAAALGKRFYRLLVTL
jgi:hypothetical protein